MKDKLNINTGDIVKISNYDTSIDNNAFDFSNLENGIFEVRETDFSKKQNGCSYGLFLGNEEGIAYFNYSEIQLVCKKESRLDL